MEHLVNLFKNIESDRQLLNLLDKSASVDGYILVSDLMKLDQVNSNFKSAQQLRQCILHPDGGKHDDDIEVQFHYDKATDCIKYLPIGGVNEYQKLCIENQYARNSIYIEGFPRKWTRYALNFMLETVLGCSNKIVHIQIEYVQPKNDYNGNSSNGSDTKHGRSSDQKQQVSESVSNTAAKRALNKGFAFIEFTDQYLVDECLELFKPADADQNTQQQSTQIYAKETLDRVQEWIHKLDKLQSDRESADVELLTELRQSLQPEELIIIARMMKVRVMKKSTWSLLKRQYLDYQLYKRCQQRVLQQMKNRHDDNTSRLTTGIGDSTSATTVQNLSTIDFVKDTIVLAYDIPLKMFKKVAIAESLMNALKTESKDCIAYIDMNPTEQLSCYIRFSHPAYTKQIINTLQQSDSQKEDSLPFKVRPLTVDEELKEWTRIVNERKAKRVVAEKYSKDSIYSSKALKSSTSSTSNHQTKQQQQPSKSSGKKQSESKGAPGNKSAVTDFNVGNIKSKSGSKQKSKTASNAVYKQEDKEEQEEEDVVGDGEALLTFMKRPTDQDVVQGDIKKLKMK
ncbi:hypothetical protein MP228_007700 [Amoeboaphelidium protococcarum]|nr:hypothetical protein MP228_007700 [Amoeboaphelidium protococcarum]